MCSFDYGKPIYKNQTEIEADKAKDSELLSNSQEQRKCSNCGFGVSETADICENCGEWLLKGKCNFCYADFEPGQRFCSECGNPPEGIKCSNCGYFSHFDFCPQCNAILTEQANEIFESIQNSEEFKKIIEMKEEDIIDEALQIPKTDQKVADNNRFNDYVSRLKNNVTTKINVFTIKESGMKKNLEENLTTLKNSKQKMEDQEKKIILEKQKETKVLKLMEKIRDKTFDNGQEARRFYGSLKILVPSLIKKRKTIGWKCNAYESIHNGGPHECAKPEEGGIWLYETITEKGFKEVEI